MLTIHNDELLDYMRASYAPGDVARLRGFLEDKGFFEFPSLPNGLFSAAVTADDELAYTGYQNVWVRDNVLVADAHDAVGRTDVAVRTVGALAEYFRKHEHRFERIIAGEADPAEVMNRPHVRFDGRALAENEEKWAHAQNDALGYFVWMYSRLAARGLLPCARDDLKLLGLFVLYLDAIRFWEDEDSGHWEEARKVSASSIGVVTGALRALRDLLRARSLFGDLQAELEQATPDRLDGLIAAGENALSSILPNECVQPDPRKRRAHDGALLFLVHPVDVVDEPMARRIVSNAIEHLGGEIGVRRYRGDSYWCADYRTKLSAEARTADVSDDMSARDALLKPGEEAQWCIFDPVLSTIHGRWYQTSGDAGMLREQTRYLNRSLAHVTARDYAPGPYRSPESYHLEDGRYVPNDVIPLLWTHANLMVALGTIERSLSR